MAWFTCFWALDVVMHVVLLSSFFKAGGDLAGEEDNWRVWRLGWRGDGARSCWGILNTRSLFWQEEEIPHLEMLLSRSPAGIRVVWRPSNDLLRLPWVFHLPRHFKDAVFRQLKGSCAMSYSVKDSLDVWEERLYLRWFTIWKTWKYALEPLE